MFARHIDDVVADTLQEAAEADCCVYISSPFREVECLDGYREANAFTAELPLRDRPQILLLDGAIFR